MTEKIETNFDSSGEGQRELRLAKLQNLAQVFGHYPNNFKPDIKLNVLLKNIAEDEAFKTKYVRSSSEQIVPKLSFSRASD